LVRFVGNIFISVVSFSKFFHFLEFFDVGSHRYWHKIVFNELRKSFLIDKVVTSRKIIKNLVFILVFDSFNSHQVTHHGICRWDLFIDLFKEVFVPGGMENEFLPCFGYLSKQLVKIHTATERMICYIDRYVLLTIGSL